MAISTSIPSCRFRLSIPWFYKSSRNTQSRADDKVKGDRSPSETVGPIPWYILGFAKSGKRSAMGPKHPTSGRSRFQKQGIDPLDQEVTNRDSDLHERVPVLPPARPTVEPRAFSDTSNTCRGTLLSHVGDNSSKHNWTPRRSSRQSRVASSGSEQNPSEATHRRDTAANVSNLQRLTEHS